MQLMNNKKFTFFRKYWLLIVVGFFVQLLFIMFAMLYYEIGFPLDDSWIHQTYARNLLHYRGWFFNPFEKSAGSTSPFWTILLIPGHFWKDFYIPWTFSISYIFFVLSAIYFEKLIRLETSISQKIPLAGILFLCEWHIAWSSVSGMETMLFVFFIVIFFYAMRKEEKLWQWIACILIGIVVFVRPDGITLLGPFLLISFVRLLKNKTKSFKDIALKILLITFFFLLYGYFNLRLAGEIFPNTFFAKQAEYSILYSTPIISRFMNLSKVPITGVGVLLLPGLIYLLYQSVKSRDWFRISGFLWFIGYIGLYAFRLPVTYQHGRYIIPAIPIYLWLSWIGTLQILQIIKNKKPVYEFGYKATIIAIILIFLFLGSKAFSLDVAIIQTEMVDTAKWIDKNIEKDAIIAAHDIGAIGFFSNHKIVDLAGLISTDVVDFITDEQRLSTYLTQGHVDYLAVFPDWYKDLTNNKDIVYKSNGIFSPQEGGENMTIYLWK